MNTQDVKVGKPESYPPFFLLEPLPYFFPNSMFIPFSAQPGSSVLRCGAVASLLLIRELIFSSLLSFSTRRWPSFSVGLGVRAGPAGAAVAASAGEGAMCSSSAPALTTFPVPPRPMWVPLWL